MDKYSVLMSVYRRVEVNELKQSVDSMMKQSIKPEQFVLVLDGPVDETVSDLINNYYCLNPELFTIVALEENHGLAYALNKGLEKCRNEYVARMDCDDYSLPERCEKQLKFFQEHPDYVLLGTSTRNYVGNISNIIPYAKKRALSYTEIINVIKRESPFCHPSVMFKKSIIQKLGGYDIEMTRSQDYELFSRLIWEGYKAANLPDVLLLYRIDDGFSSRTRSKESCDCRIKIQKKLLLRKQCSFADYIYIFIAMKVTRILPEKIYKDIYKLIKQ